MQSLNGIITPNGLFFERFHAGRVDVDPRQHRLLIHGLVERPLVLTMDDIVRFPSVSRIHFIECPANGGMEWREAQLNSLQFTHGMIGCAEWTGVPLSTLLEEVGLKKEAKWVMVEGADGARMNRSLPLAKCLDDCLIVYAQNGEALRPEQGYPLRILVPGWQGNVSVKWLRRIKLGDAPWYSREETSKYTELMPDGKARGFTWVNEAKSVITFPCPEKPAAATGLYEIRELAWCGRGKIKQVDVSVDGGRNWHTAQLDDPILSKALTRFSLPMALGRHTGLAAIARGRRNRPCATDYRAIAQGAWHQSDLSQQRNPDLGSQAGRRAYSMSSLARAVAPASCASCFCSFAAVAGSPGAFGYGTAATPLRNRRLEYRRTRQRRGRLATGQGRRQPRRGSFYPAMRALPRHVWRGRRPLSQA